MGRFLMQVVKLWVVFWLCSKLKSVFVFPLPFSNNSSASVAEKFDWEQPDSKHGKN